MISDSWLAFLQKEGTLKSILNVENKLKKIPFYLEYVSSVRQVSSVPIKKRKETV